MRTRKVLEEIEDYVPGKSIPGGIKLSSNENSLGPSPKAVQAIAEVSTTIHRYPDGTIADLRAALAEAWNVSDEMIIVGNGSDEILVMLAAAYMNPGDNAVTSEHTFSQYAFASTLFDGTMRYAAMDNGTVQLDRIAHLVDGRTRFVFLCNPNNPTGTWFPHNALSEFVRSIPTETIVVVDEAYAEYADDDEFPRAVELVQESSHIVQLRTFSKIYGLAGLRVGYGIGNPELIRQLWKVRQPFNVGRLAQVGATAAISDAEFVAASLEKNRTGKEQLSEGLRELGIAAYPTQANFICADLERDARTTVEGMMSRGIAIRPLHSFGLPNHVRITIGTAEEISRLLDALGEVVT